MGIFFTKRRVLVRFHAKKFTRSSPKTWEDKFLGIPFLAQSIARYREIISAIPPYCALWGFWCLNMANWVRYPLPSLSVSPLERTRSGGAIPPLKRDISAILARYPLKTRQMGAIPPSAILSRKGIARYGEVSRIGPLSCQAFFFAIRGESIYHPPSPLVWP